MKKDFKDDFIKLFLKFKSGENFSFTRFSDGELFVMQKKRLVLAQNQVVVGDIVHNFGYDKEDHKDFDPEKHGFVGDLLVDAYKHKQHNYYVGLSCPCCVSQEDNQWMKDLRNGDEEFTTWANLFVNANYPLFLRNFYQEFKKKKIVIVCNENAKINSLPFEVVKDFRIGPNAIVNNLDLPERIEKWIDDNNIENHVFLLAATSISNLIAYKCFSKNSNNTFLDVGSTMNKFMEMGIARDYLRYFWEFGYRTPEYYPYCRW